MKKMLSLLVAVVLCFSCAGVVLAVDEESNYVTEIAGAPRIIHTGEMLISTAKGIEANVNYTYNDTYSAFSSINSVTITNVPDGMSDVTYTYQILGSGTSDPYVLFTFTYKIDGTTQYGAETAKLYKPF